MNICIGYKNGLEVGKNYEFILKNCSIKDECGYIMTFDEFKFEATYLGYKKMSGKYVDAIKLLTSEKCWECGNKFDLLDFDCDLGNDYDFSPFIHTKEPIKRLGR